MPQGGSKTVPWFRCGMAIGLCLLCLGVNDAVRVREHVPTRGSEEKNLYGPSG